jgi:LEA14-like dessication related protein
MKRAIKIISLILAVFILASCSIYKSVDIGDVNNVDFKGMKDNKFILNLAVPISNTNGYKIKIKSMDLDLKINGSYIGKMTIENEIVVPPKSDEVQEFPIVIVVRNPLASMATMYKMRNSKSFDMEMEGTIKVKALLKSKTIKVSEKQRVKL